MAKRIIAALLAVAMLLALAACGGDGGSSSSQESSAASQGGESSESSQTSDGESSAASASGDLKEPELVTLDIVTMASGKEESGIAEVEEAMNAILEEKFNINVKLTFLPFGS